MFNAQELYCGKFCFKEKNLSSHPTKDYVKMALNRIKRTSMLQTFNAHFMYVIKQHQIVD